MNAQNNTLEIIAGLDIGNGWTKGRYETPDGDFTGEIDIPSGATTVTRPNDAPEPDDQAPVLTAEAGWFNQLDVSFPGDSVADGFRHLLGERGLVADGFFEEFDTTGKRSKVEQELSSVLVLGLLAGAGLRSHLQRAGSLPVDEPLYVRANIALALPIIEFAAHRKAYTALFAGKRHEVVVNNFSTPVRVVVDVVDVVVIAEGASAQYAITDKGLPLMEGMFHDLRSRGMGQALEGITPSDVLAAQNTIGIDIGEGTTNLPVFSQRAFNADASTTFTKGYGSVLTRSLKAMEEQGFNGGFRNRKQLASFLSSEISPMKRGMHARVREFVDTETAFFSSELAMQFGRVLQVVGVSTEVVYVFGGGSGQVKETLYPLLVDKVREVTGMDSIPVLYLASDYSRRLNREGLLLAARRRYTTLAQRV